MAQGVTMAVDLTDPVSTANAASVSSNIKTFSHAPDLILNTLMTDMVESQRAMRQITLATLARATRVVMDEASDSVGDAVLLQQGAKVAQTTPPDTSGQLSALAAQVATITQMLQNTFANTPVANSTKA